MNVFHYNCSGAGTANAPPPGLLSFHPPLTRPTRAGEVRRLGALPDPRRSRHCDCEPTAGVRNNDSARAECLQRVLRFLLPPGGRNA